MKIWMQGATMIAVSLVVASVCIAQIAGPAQHELILAPPTGYAPLTEDMALLRQVVQSVEDPYHLNLGAYIPESQVAAALMDELTELPRYCLLKENRELSGAAADLQLFRQIKSALKADIGSMVSEIEPELREAFGTTGAKLSETFDTELALRLFSIVPFEPHEESEQTLSFSLIMNVGTASENGDSVLVIAVTTTMLLVRGRILSLNCYGTAEDLEWTRTMSREWADELLRANAPQPSGAETSRLASPGAIAPADDLRFDWAKFAAKLGVGAVLGGAVAAILAIARKSKT